MRGVAAPAMLFSGPPAPTIRPLSAPALYQPAKSDSEALRNDMARIGNDFRRAIQKSG